MRSFWKSSSPRKSICASLLVGAAVTSAVFAYPINNDRQDGQETDLHSNDPVATNLADQLSLAFQSVAETITPSLVNITAVKKIEAPRMRQIPGPFGELFGDFRFHQQPREPLFQQGLGSGFIIDDSGYVLTNHHVIGDADEVTVRLHDDRTFAAEVIGSDPKTDVAVLKIEADDLTPVTLGDSDALNVGQWVVAAGSPFGLRSSISTGIISAMGRSRMGITDYEDFIQTDAAINPGNSGGPLTNLHGEVVAINTAIFSRSGGHNGIGFAIPINMVKSIMDRLIEDGRVIRGWLGVYIQNLNEGLADSFGYGSTNGALVGDVPADTPAERAGIQPGDVITHFNGEEVPNVDWLRLEVASTRPGTEVELKVHRDGDTKSLTVEIGELPGEVLTEDTQKTKAAELGLSLRNLTPEISNQLGYQELEGVVVAKVEPFSPAARAGVQQRDLIVAVQGEDVTDIDEFYRVVGKHDLSKGVRLTIQSGNAKRYVFLQMN